MMPLDRALTTYGCIQAGGIRLVCKSGGKLASAGSSSNRSISMTRNSPRVTCSSGLKHSAPLTVSPVKRPCSCIHLGRKRIGIAVHVGVGGLAGRLENLHGDGCLVGDVAGVIGRHKGKAVGADLVFLGRVDIAAVVLDFYGAALGAQ